MAQIIQFVPRQYIYCKGRSFHWSWDCQEVQKATTRQYLTIEEIKSLNRWGGGIRPCQKCMTPELREILQSLLSQDQQDDPKGKR